MKKLLFVLLFSFMLVGCSNTEDNGKVEEVTENATVQADATEETSELTTEGVATTQMASATEEAVTAEAVTEEESAQQTDEASDSYAVCTSHSKEEVEMFAQKVKDYILNKDWESLAGTISYPITVQSNNNLTRTHAATAITIAIVSCVLSITLVSQISFANLAVWASDLPSSFNG